MMGHEPPASNAPCSLWIVHLCLLVTLNICRVYGTECGGYIQASRDGTGTVRSPGYPDNYTNSVNCIWLIEAEPGFAISLTIDGVQAEKTDDGTACVDYVEMRNGSSVETLAYYECDSSTSQSVQARWLWIKFYSNHENTNKGFTASWKVVVDLTTYALSEPFIECPLRFHCSNKECVPYSYRCDGYSDCGCDGAGCDEVGCGGLSLTANQRIAIGISVGFITFVMVFFGIFLIDYCLKKRAERKYQERLETQKKLQKRRKAREMANLFMSQTSTDGSRMSASVAGRASFASGMLRVPSISSTMTASSLNNSK